MIFYKLFSSFPLEKNPTEPTTAHGSRCSSCVPRTSLASRTEALRWIADPNRRRSGSETKKHRWFTANQAVKHRMGLKRHGFTMANLERFFSFSWVRLGYKLSRVIHICWKQLPWTSSKCLGSEVWFAKRSSSLFQINRITCWIFSRITCASTVRLPWNIGAFQTILLGEACWWFRNPATVTNWGW